MANTSTNNDNKMVIPGEYLIESLVVESYNGLKLDLRNNMIELVIHEDIYQNFIFGELLIAENVSLAEHLPFIANETLTVSFMTVSRKEPITQTFFIYKIQPSMSLGTNVYSLYFASESFMTCHKTKISRSFTNMPYSEMVKSVYNDYFGSKKPIQIQSTLGSKHIVIPYMHPAKAINWISTRCISDDAKDFAYVFYETLDKYCFTTINYENSLNYEPSVTYAEYSANYTRPNNVFRELNQDFFRIETYERLTSNDTLQNTINGVFASGILTHDLTYKEIDYNTFSYNNDYEDLSLMDGYGMLPKQGDTFSDNSLSHLRYYPKNSYLFDGIKDADEYELVALRRNAHLAHMKTNKLSILVAGDSNRRIGEIVNILLYSNSAEKNVNDNPYDRYLSGKYLITKISHILQKEQYKMRVELERDSQEEPYPEEKVFV